MSSIHVSQNYS